MNIIKSVFKTDKLNGMQINFLKCLRALPDMRRLYGDEVLDCHIKMAKAADEILRKMRHSSSG